MNDLQPSLAECDQALAEADLLIASLDYGPARLEVELSGIRKRIATLRHEVERLRGMRVAPIRQRVEPDWTDLGGGESPWCTVERNAAPKDQPRNESI